MHPRPLLASMAIAASLSGMALAGCGGTPEAAPRVATLTPASSAPGADGASGSGETAAVKPVSAEEQAQALRDFAKCMREHGVDMPDPEIQGGEGGAGGPVVFSASAAGGGESGGPDGGPGAPPGTAVMDEAQKACGSLMDKLGPNGVAPQLDPAEEAKMREHALAFSKCMREHGVDMPDPQFEGGGVMMVIEGDGSGGGIDPTDQSFQDAQKACEPIMGLPGGVGPGGAIAVGPEGGSVSGAGVVISPAAPAGGK